VKKSKQKKPKQGGKPRVEQTADQTNHASKNDYGFAAKPVRQFPAEWPGEHRGECKQRNDQPLIISPSKMGQKFRQFGDDHVKAGKKEQCADAQQPELGTINPLFLHLLEIKNPPPHEARKGK